MYNVLDFICIISGVYLLYTGIVMKTQGKIIGNVVLSKGVDENAIRDKEGFIRYLYGKLILIGAVIILSGVVNLVSDYRGGGNGMVALVTCAVFGASLVAYGMIISKALKKFTK